MSEINSLCFLFTSHWQAVTYNLVHNGTLFSRSFYTIFAYYLDRVLHVDDRINRIVCMLAHLMSTQTA